jgi:hypothetical protein
MENSQYTNTFIKNNSKVSPEERSKTPNKNNVQKMGQRGAKSLARK